MKCLFIELFTFICSQGVSRINVSGCVNCEIFLWCVFMILSHNLCSFTTLWLWMWLLAVNFNKKHNNIYFISTYFFPLLFLLHVTHAGASSFLPLLSCPADWCLHRMAACAASPGAEADVDGFTHLKALVGQPQDERWPLGGKKEGGAGA